MTTSFTQLLRMWVVFFLGTSIALFMFELLFPSLITFGTATITPVRALFQNAAIISFVVVGAVVALEEMCLKHARLSLERFQFLTMLVVNTGMIWLLSRLAEQMGFGISSWIVALVLASILQLIQSSSLKTILPELDY